MGVGFFCGNRVAHLSMQKRSSGPSCIYSFFSIPSAGPSSEEVGQFPVLGKVRHKPVKEQKHAQFT